MERRIANIFSWKKSIIDQAKHQSDLFDEFLASELLVRGIDPPSWLRTPLFQSQNVDCAGSFPQSPEFAIPSNNAPKNKMSEAEYDAEHVEFPVQSESLQGRSSTSPPLPASGPRCSLHDPNLDSSPIHLQDNEDAISDNVQDPAMSLARLQRSKSRQRAIELRNSAKSARRLQDEKNGSVFDGRVSGTAITSLRSNHVHEVDSQERDGLKECDHIEEGPVTRPRLSYRKNSSSDVNNSIYVSDKDETARADDGGKQQSRHASGKLELFSSCSGPIGTDSAIIHKQKKKTRSRRIKERRTNSYCGRITRSMIYSQNYHNANTLSMPHSSFNTVGDDGCRVRPTSCNSSFPQLVDGCAAGSIGPLEHAGEQSGVKSLSAIVKGKRDIKVKALDAAEATKHLAENKENERKMKKEAMKLERERMKQENLKQLEMQRKKKEEKEEEQKKKEADMEAKKRQREEEERKEKERKMLRTKQIRKRQREDNEQLEMQRKKKEEEQKKKEADMEAKKSQREEEEREKKEKKRLRTKEMKKRQREDNEQLEMQRKKKEEEQKKKEADMEAKKRQREEEEREEKERKRFRTKEIRKRQREDNEQLEMQRKKKEEEQKKKEADMEAKKRQREEEEREEKERKKFRTKEIRKRQREDNKQLEMQRKKKEEEQKKKEAAMEAKKRQREEEERNQEAAA